MAKKRTRKREPGADRGPKTIGDLRKLLAQLGNPWRPDPKLSDAEPIPQFPTGGDGRVAPVGRVLPKGRAIDAIRRDPPTNPHLRDLWIERGLLGRSERFRKSTGRRSRRSGGDG